MRIIRPKKMEHHKVLYTNFRKYCPRCSLLVLRDVIMYFSPLIGTSRSAETDNAFYFSGLNKNETTHHTKIK